MKLNYYFHIDNKVCKCTVHKLGYKTRPKPYSTMIFYKYTEKSAKQETLSLFCLWWSVERKKKTFVRKCLPYNKLFLRKFSKVKTVELDG
jgi:hypothetical protein